MIYDLQAGGFAVAYVESVIDAPVVWEKHCHTQYEMISVLEGDISIMLEGRSYRLTKGQTVFVPPLYYHAVTANKQGTYRRVTALFALDAIPAVLQAHYRKKDARLTVFLSGQSEELRKLCRSGDDPLYRPLAQSLMIGLLYGDLRAEQADTETETDEFLRTIIAYIDSHLRERILLDDLAILTSRSKSSVCHLFEEKMNITPKQYILQKKLALAHKLIDGGTPPTLAAMQVGYDNYSNFYRMYRKVFETSPSEGKAKKLR